MSNNGRQGELLFKRIMEQRGYKVIDVSNNPAYWNYDIDFVITSPATGATKNFEVKWDTRIHNTGNLYLELTNVHSKQWNGEGWFKHCQAEYLVYGDAQAQVFYVIPFQQLKERTYWLPQKIVNCGTDSTGLLVSLKDIEDLIQIVC